MSYLRIGTEYYKVVSRPSLSGGTHKTVIKWKRQTIIDDEGKEYLNNIPKYHGFIVLPSHNDYKKEIGGFYNKYMPLDHKIGKHKSEIKIDHTLQFLDHIFGDQFEIGLDYLSLLWQKPTQLLPILCLVSEERSTGKTTFLNWLKLIFQDNMTINKNEDFRSRFNADWSERLIIGVDEVLLDRKEDSERIKNLSTANIYKTESKGVDKAETLFFGKFILCSNNEDNFIIVDEKEIRFWVRKLSPIKELNPDFMDKLAEELNDFATFIATRKITNLKRSRMWFTPEQLKTKALKRLVNGTKYHLERELLLFLQDVMEDYEVDEICFSINELKDQLKGVRSISIASLNKVLVYTWKLKPRNSSYKQYSKKLEVGAEWTVDSFTKKGRFYRFTKEFVEEKLNC